MKNNSKWDLFKIIFSDSHIVDIDFSRWDKLISVYVIADHVYHPVPSRLPIFAVEFHEISKISFEFKDMKVKMDNPSHHVQWIIDKYEVEELNVYNRVILSSSFWSPSIEIVFHEFLIHQIDHSEVDKKFPGWNKPHKGLIRPPIDAR